MSETQVAALPTPPDLPTDLPEAAPSEPPELVAYREKLGDERRFVAARRRFRESQDWRAMATLLVLHAAHTDKSSKSAELCLQAAELWVERAKEPEEAARALARALEAQPDNPRAYERLHRLYQELGWEREYERLLQWRIMFLSLADPTALPQAHLELAAVYENETLAISKAVAHYRIVLRQDPTATQASERLIVLHLGAGAWAEAEQLIHDELGRIGNDPQGAQRVCELNLRLSRIAHEVREDVAGAARHLQAAIKASPNSLKALRAFGVLYLGSGKASTDGMQKAAGIFFKAAENARDQGDLREATRLLRRSLSLRPGDMAASQALEAVLAQREHWMELEELYAEMLGHLHGPDATRVLIARGRLLEDRLSRSEEARVCYELARAHQGPDGEAWQALDRIYEATSDWHALAGLLEYRVEAMGEAADVDTLIRTATVYAEQLDDGERAATFYYMVLERDPFNAQAFEGYKEHFRRKHNWAALRDLILYQIDQAVAAGEHGPLGSKAFIEEFLELADINERRLGDVDGAIDAWQRLGSAYPQDPRPKQQISRIEKRNRMWDNMLRVQESELEKTGDEQKRVEILKRLTQIYRDRQPDPTRAIELYNEILAIRPDDVQTKRALTALYDRAGDFEQVLNILRDQYERSKSNTERVQLLRRMAELWHDEESVRDESSAAWACDQILTYVPKDATAHHRLQLIHQEAANWEGMLDALSRELEIASTSEAKIGLMRRMARIAEEQLRDRDRSAELWYELMSLEPSNLEFVDRIIAVYEQAGRWEELAELLSRAASSPKTPVIRQLDYLDRLAQLAHHTLGDRELARNAYERVLKIRADHRGAAEALVNIYREQEAYDELAEALGRLQQLVDSDEEAQGIAWERSGLLLEQLDDPHGASEVLMALAAGVSRGNPHVNERLLQVHELTGDARKLIAQAELMLLGATATDERRGLYDRISQSWLRLGEKNAALATYNRFMKEFEHDDAGMVRLAQLQAEVGEPEAAFATLTRRLNTNADPLIQLETLRKLAQLADEAIGDPQRAVQVLSQGFDLDPLDDILSEQLEAMAQRHGNWPEVLSLFEARANKLREFADVEHEVEMCQRASQTCDEQLEDAERAMAWLQRAWAADTTGAKHDELDDLARELGERRSAWAPLRAYFDQKLAAERLDETQAVAQLQELAELCDEHLSDPPSAVRYLRRALEIEPENEALYERAQAVAEAAGTHEALLELHRFALSRANSNLARFEAHVAIAKVLETHLDDPAAGFSQLRRAWADLRRFDGSLAEEALDLAMDLARRHELWTSVAQHHINSAAEAFADSDRDRGLDLMLEAARCFDEQVGDTMAALRCLIAGLPHDPQMEVILPRIREYAEALDEKAPADTKTLGALAELRANGEVIAAKRTQLDVVVSLLERRADIRERRLNDPVGAMTEWFRVLVIDPEHGRADEELERLAGVQQSWNYYLCLPAWRAQVAADPDEEARHYKRLAEIFETKLNKPEHAFRALTWAWRCAPQLPELGEALNEDNQKLWRLAGVIGNYRDPELPRDPLTHPELVAPELGDLEAWTSQGYDPESFAAISAAPSMELDVGHTAELSDIGMVLEGDDDDQDDAELISNQTPQLHVGAGLDALADDEEDDEAHDDAGEVMELDEIVEIDDLEELELLEDLDELEASGEFDADAAPASRPPTPPPVKAPPPAPRAPFDLARGLPTLPQLHTPILPKRPPCDSAWGELARVYLEAPAPNKQARVHAQLAVAHLWDDGADQTAEAFSAHEQALSIIPEHPVALESLVALADRREARGRLIDTYARLLNDAVLPEHVVALGLRIAALHELDEAWSDAESRYRGVLAVQGDHTGALAKLADIYESQARWPEYADAIARRLDAEVRELEEDERVERSLGLASIYETRLDQPERAIDLLRVLVRDFPHRSEIHRFIARLLLAMGASAQAIEAMKSGIEATSDETLEQEFLPEMAKVYETQLELPRRAIEAWARLSDLDREHAGAWDALARLYLAEGRHAEHLEALDARLAILERKGDDADPAVRTRLLVRKAKSLQEGIGDEDAALAALEDLHHDAPDNDDVRIGLAGLYAKADRFDDGLSLLTDRLAAFTANDDEAHQRREALCLALCDLLQGRPGGPEQSVSALSAALERSPGREALLRRRVKLCRQTHQLELLVDSLGALPDHAGHLEAAEIARVQLADSSRASRLYGRVLEDAKGSDDARDIRRQMLAIEGLVQLRIDDDDVEGAMAFMDKQLAEVDRPEVEAQLLTEIGRITYRTTKDADGARTRFEAALAIDANHPGASLGLGELALAAEDLAAAESLFEKAIEAYGLVNDQSGLVEALVGLAKVFERSDRAGEAYRRLNTALRHDPNNLGIRTALVRNRFEARRWRDVLTAADKLEASLEEKPNLEAGDRRLAGTIFTYAADAERELKHTDKALARLELALEIDPENGRAMEHFLPILRERGEFERAASFAARRAEISQGRAARASALFDSGTLYHEAATALRTTGTGERDAEREGDLRSQGFDALRRALSLAKDGEGQVLTRAQLEGAFQLASGSQPDVALDCAERLLTRDDLEDGFRHELLLDAAKLSGQTGREGDASRSVELARRAVEVAPNSCEAVLALAEALESRGDTTQLTATIEGYFERVPTAAESSDASASRVLANAHVRRQQIELLKLLALHQADAPAKAAHTLERALQIDPGGLDLAARRHLAGHYDQLDRTLDDPEYGQRVGENLDAMLALDPVDVSSLARLARDCQKRGDLDRAHALYTVIALREPEHQDTLEFYAAHEANEGGHAQLDLSLLQTERDSAGGVPEALAQVWDAGANLLTEFLPKAEFDSSERVSPVGDSALSRAWGEVLKHVGQTKVAFVNSPALADALGHGQDERGFVHLCAQYPPILVADAQAAACEDDATLRFAIARALFLARPEALLMSGLTRKASTNVLDAILLAFHPRHAKRKGATRGSDEAVPKLAQEFSRKLPIRVSRQIGAAFKDAVDEPFDSRAFRAELAMSSNRVGLAMSGDIRAALRVILGEFEAGEDLAQRLAKSSEARALVAFALTPTYLKLRRSMGVSVEVKST